MYARLVKSLNQMKGFYPVDELKTMQLDEQEDWYSSIYYYTDAHRKRYAEKGTVAGIKDVVTDRLVFDLDNEHDLEAARQDTLLVISRLQSEGVDPAAMELYFSGMKGFSIVVNLTRLITPYTALGCATRFAGDLGSFDTKIYDPQRILRVPGTRHQGSGLFKVPLTFPQLQEMEVDSIKERASSLDNITEDFAWEAVDLPDAFFETPELDALGKADASSMVEMSLDNRPYGWKRCKWSLVQGNFGETSGERHHALMIIASTCRALGYDKDTTYYICKSALKKQAARTGRDEFPKEELWRNIIETSVFSDSWEGGSYSCAKDPWLREYCLKVNGKTCTSDKDEKGVVELGDITGDFEKYATNFEQNLVKTGIRTLDENVIFSTSTLIGLLGNPGSGKTSMALNYLKNTSQSGVASMFFSLDMGMPLVYAKLLQKETGMGFKQVLQMFKDDPGKAKNLGEKVRDIYGNVGFCFKGGLTVQDMKKMVNDRNEETGKHTRLIVIDYLECIAGPYADPIASGGFIANQLKDMANELEACVLLLLQTQKHSTPSVADPLLSLKGVKGSSIIEQSCSAILTLWREGYDPKYQDRDKFISFAVVKNRFGPLWTGDFSWDGVRGDIRDLSDEGSMQLEDFRHQKKEDKIREAEESDGWR